MTLLGRTSVFFLAVLAVGLVAFSLVFFGLARYEMSDDIDERLQSALNTLSAAVEGKPNGLTWEPDEHRFTLGIDAGPEQVRWTVTDGEGHVITRSQNLPEGQADPPAEALSDALRGNGQTTTTDAANLASITVSGEPWRVLSRRIQSGSLTAPLVRPRQRVLYPTLVLTVGLSLRPLQATLQDLLLTCLGISAALWIAAALAGRWLGRRALAPLTRMASAARGMPATSLDQRLPLPGTHDELQDMAAAFNDLLTRVQDTFERQRRFTSEASHQLRTPLTAVLGQVEVALRQDRDVGDYRQALQTVHRQTQRLIQIVETLLFLAHGDAEAQLRQMETVDLRAWLRDHLASCSEHARTCDVVVRTADDPLPVRIQPFLLGQLLDNLLDNACKYSRPGTPVTARALQRNGRAVLEVEDHGLGIPAEDLPKLFTPFFRGAEARRQGVEGVGLGLAVVKRIAEALHTTVDAHSEPGTGSTFRMELPLCRGAPLTPAADDDDGTASLQQA